MITQENGSSPVDIFLSSMYFFNRKMWNENRVESISLVVVNRFRIELVQSRLAAFLYVLCVGMYIQKQTDVRKSNAAWVSLWYMYCIDSAYNAILQNWIILKVNFYSKKITRMKHLTLFCCLFCYVILNNFKDKVN